MYNKVEWISANKLAELRQEIRSCPDADYREEGLGCLRGVRKGEYLSNLIPQDHPDRIGIFKYLTSRRRMAALRADDASERS